jgi:ribosomal protein S18 acetylase RimI-like enzyme
MDATPAVRPALRPAAWPDDGDTVRTLFREYAAMLGEDLCFQSFDQELATLPGKYAPPQGNLLLAEVSGEPAGCIALRPLADGACEMKRLFVRPALRGLGLGRLLSEAIIADARTRGFRVMRLDTLKRLEAAIALYRDLGFRTIPAYCANPIADVVYMELDLR